MQKSTVIAAALLTLAGAAWADTQNFVVNAQYRGMVKKAFRDIGTGTMTDSGSATGTVQLQGHARVDHPTEQGKVYDMTLDMSLKVQGATITEVSNRSKCNPGSEEALATTQKIAPFVHIAKWARGDQSTDQTFTTPRGTFQLRLATTDRNLEASLYEGDQMVGKFFMSPGEQLPRQLEKFRITTSGGTMISFVSTNAVASR